MLARDPQLRAQGYTREQEQDYEAFCEEEYARYEAERITGLAECPECGEQSAARSTVCTLGYPGHPGADYSALLTCINPECEEVTL